MPKRPARLTKGEFRRHVLFCELSPGQLAIHGDNGWVPCTQAQTQFLEDQPRVDPSRLAEEPGSLRAFKAFIVPGLTKRVVAKQAKPEQVPWFDEAKWLETGRVSVTW